MPHVLLELYLRPAGGACAADATLRQPGSHAEPTLARAVPLALGPDALAEHSADPEAYGRALTAALFAEPTLREAWNKARALADGAALPLCLRLRLAADAPKLHMIRWETLRDPTCDTPLASDANLRLVRALDSSDTRKVAPGPRPELRALLLIANPADLGRFTLAEIDVDGELARVRTALGSIPLTVLAQHDDAAGPATLAALRDTLRRAQPAILCLICHGMTNPRSGATTLVLEDAQGAAALTPGAELAALLTGLDTRPLLTVLIACEGGALAALGPQLAQAGLAAVLAMQGKLTLASAKRFLPPLFEELARDGRLDRALAHARAALSQRPDWWVPALWLRTDGRLWEQEGRASALAGGISIGGNVGTVQQIIISGGTVGSIIGNQQHASAPPAAASSGPTQVIAVQRRRLDQYRATLAHYLDQLSITGLANARPEVSAGIREARAGIAQAKAALAALGTTVADMPDDAA